MIGLQNLQPAHVGEPCPKAPEPSVHVFCFAGALTATAWAEAAQCKWCGITPNGEIRGPRRIQLSRVKGFRLQEYSLALNGRPACKVDRTTVFGNPFPVKAFGIEQALALFETWFDLTDEQIRENYPGELGARLVLKRFNLLRGLPGLRGNNIACWCQLPEPYERDRCHGATLLRIANRPPRRIQISGARGWRMPPNAWPVNKGIWTNPYEDGPADLRVAMYRDHLRDAESRRAAIVRRRIGELRGYDIACTCSLDEPCHGDVLLEIANG